MSLSRLEDWKILPTPVFIVVVVVSVQSLGRFSILSCQWRRHTRTCQGKCPGRSASALAVVLAAALAVKVVIYIIIIIIIVLLSFNIIKCKYQGLPTYRINPQIQVGSQIKAGSRIYPCSGGSRNSVRQGPGRGIEM